MKFLLLVILILMVGCGEEVSSGYRGLQLEVQLPNALRREDRLRHFNRRVVLATVRFETKHGVLVEQSLPPAQWDGIGVPQLEFPKDENDVLAISVRIWDRKRNGVPRSYPVLAGHAHIRAAELGDGKANTIPVRLTLAVLVNEYD